MKLSFCSFSSGSSGNCYLVKAGDTTILIDAGISAKRIMDGLRRTKTPPESVRAILITHEHSDHTKGLATISAKLPNVRIYANMGTWQGMGIYVEEEKKAQFCTGDRFAIGGIEIRTFSLSHDTPDPSGFALCCDNKGIAIVTDTGIITEEIMEEIEDADILVLEANHDINMLKRGRYPMFLKQRILGKRGHLSNELAGETIVRIMNKAKKPRCVLLAHLSMDNNRPDIAMDTTSAILEDAGYIAGSDLYLGVLYRDVLSVIYEI